MARSDYKPFQHDEVMAAGKGTPFQHSEMVAAGKAEPFGRQDIKIANSGGGGGGGNYSITLKTAGAQTYVNAVSIACLMDPEETGYPMTDKPFCAAFSGSMLKNGFLVHIPKGVLMMLSGNMAGVSITQGSDIARIIDAIGSGSSNMKFIEITGDGEVTVTFAER